jgi:hypothetical protein
MKGTIDDSRINVYLGLPDKKNNYENTAEESQLVSLWNQKYLLAKAEYESSLANSKEVTKWRNAYLGDFFRLDAEGNETSVKMKALQKVAYELVESKVISLLPGPKMSPRYYSDIMLVNATEALLNHEIDRMLSEEIHDESEHSCLIDGTSWLKVEWDPLDNTNERSGMPKVISCPVDTVYPQPGISDYKKLEYIFELTQLTVATIMDLYGRQVVPNDGSDLVEVVQVYYLNANRQVGHLVYTVDSLIVLANDLEWSMRKVRKCNHCGSIVRISDTCPICGGKKFSYKSTAEEVLSEDLVYIENKFRSSESADQNDDTERQNTTKTIPAGTKVPYYLIRQLPFVPKRTTKLPKNIYGISEVKLALEEQDSINKLLNKAEAKSASSKAYVTKLKDTRINDDDEEITYIEIESAQEGQAVQVKQVTADISEELAMMKVLYENSRSSSGVTDTDQGKYDPSAKSGRAKEAQLMASAQRQSSSKIQRNSAYAGVYELIFKYLLAYSDEERSFVALMPDGSSREEVWSKYMFLTKSKQGQLYYRDDFAWSVDSVAYITKDRETMWELIDRDFLNGTTGSEIDPQRALLMYWHMKDQHGYPTAKFAINFLKENAKHLPSQIEQALLNNPEAVELALSYIQDLQSGKVAEKQPAAQPATQSTTTSNNGGARDNAGKPNNGQTHNQQQAATNAKQKAEQEVQK